ncbi:MAG TPA: CPBP family intramembrane glutamic endopeptidase [Stackebrandtia sp.]|uniref:CPBP family intramembrane glutamic endopeptidase n=1 Tax=Stackebrandtia sp. TaxID=2023065 RepID=UPI002D264A10|nr:CPBP family intramembrane glutamic endopeptidase [Stackebrandtia sp.]HZE39701.1 CPBP family intramembrane glutamic endopeptidase [Stackebrandtia sp.]
MAVSVLIVVAMMALLQVENVFTASNVYKDSLYGTVLRAALCLALVWLVARSGLLSAIGLTSSPAWQAAWLWWLPILMVAAMTFLQLAAVGITDNGLWLGLSAAHVFFVGFLEELVIRGVVLFLLVYAWRERTYGVVAAVLASSALFGAAHIVNSAFGGDAPWGETLPQVGYAFLIGVGVSGLVLRTNTLWLAIVWHAAFDFVGIGLVGPSAETVTDKAMDTTPTAQSSLGQMAPFVILFVYGLILVRRRKSVAEPVPSPTAPAHGL